MIGGAEISAAVRAGAREMLISRAGARPSERRQRRIRPESKGRKRNKGKRRKAKAPGMSRKYLIETFGCQMNVHDSERMAGLLEQAGYEPTD